MPKFLIIESDPDAKPQAGKGARGRNLAQFLKKYYGSRSVAFISSQFLRSSSKKVLRTEHLFIGIPTLLDKATLDRIKFDKAHLFDYYDLGEFCWGNSDQDLLRNLTSSYLKSWTESHWDKSFKWGCLPIRRYARLPICLNVLKFCGNFPTKNRNRPFDTAFLGNPFAIWVNQYNGSAGNPRIEWLREIAGNQNYTYTGGFTIREKERKRTDTMINGDQSLARLISVDGRQGFPTYFKQMTQAKTALAPPGNARWSYRHYESIYAGAIPITADFRNADMLVPLPMHGIVHIETGQSIIPGLEHALKLLRDNPDLPSQNLAHVEQFLTMGAYDRKKTKLLKRFISQL